jgi:tetratricopeptide (TPR) repeat protein
VSGKLAGIQYDSAMTVREGPSHAEVSGVRSLPGPVEVLLASLRGRTVEYTERGDASAVLADQALVEAGQLRQAAQVASLDGEMSLQIVSTVAWLHWCRYLALPRGLGRDELRAAARLFGEIMRVDPALVPDQLRVVLAVAATPTEGPDAWAAQATVTLQRAMRTNDAAALDQAVGFAQQAVRAASANHPNRPMMLSLLATALQIRFQWTGNLTDLDAKISALREAVDAAPISDPQRALYLSTLGKALRDRFEWVGEPADLDAAITGLREAVDATPTDNPLRAVMLSEFGVALHGRFEWVGELADLDAAITALREAVDASPVGDPDRAGFLSSFGIMLQARFERVGEPADLDAAIVALREAIDATRTNNSRRTLYLSNLGVALAIRLRRFSDLTDGHAAIAALREAVDDTPTDNPDRAEYLSNLGAALQARFEKAGESADMDAAITALREADEVMPVDHRGRAAMLTNLGTALLTRFGGSGDSADLDDAITALRGAVGATPAEHPKLALYLSNLGPALRTRFERFGDLTDLDEAITALGRAVEVTPVGHPIRARYLSSLGNALRTRFDRTRDRTDLDAAISAGQKASDATPTDDPDRALVLTNLSNALQNRFDLGGDTTDIDVAISALHEAIEIAPRRHANRALYLSNLGAALRGRFERVGDLTDLDAAIAALHEAIETAPPNHPNRAAYLFNLGAALQIRFRRTQDPADAEVALVMWQNAATSVTARTSDRMNSGRAWGALAASLGRWPDAAEGYAKAVELLPLLVWRGVGRSSRERLLADWGGLAADAAACAIAAGQPDRAVELLEQGRGVLWSQLLETRTDLTALRNSDHDRAARLDALRAELDRPTTLSEADTAGSEPALDVDARMAAARQWDTLIGEVRGLPGFHDFARYPTAAQLRLAAAEGAVVVVNISRWRCSALLVTNEAIRVRQLPDLTYDAVLDRATIYLDAVLKFQNADRDPNTARIALEQAITRTLEWLWDAIAEPVLETLGHQHTPMDGQPWPRLWWCPTGILTVLPLHAAGYHDQHDGRSVLDRVISSYAPTLRALSTARSRPQSTAPGRLLLIALPNTPHATSHELVRLPAVAAEQALLSKLFDDARRTVLADTDATRANILRELATHAWVHASCHGDQNLLAPTTGGLLPYDWKSAGPVGVLELSTSDHAAGEFVFLSACKTATGGVTNLDESINLAAALHYSGWRHVIGTLWSVWDDAAADITKGTYPRLVSNGHLDPIHTAEAVHHALRDYRDRDNHRYQPSRWSPFLHIGP